MPNLIITRRRGQSVSIGQAIVRIESIGRSHVTLAIRAPLDIEIVRDDVVKQRKPTGPGTAPGSCGPHVSDMGDRA